MGKNHYELGADVARDEVLYDSHGRPVDDAYVDEAVETAVAYVRERGRPSLSHSGESPLLRVRLPRELDDAVTAAAQRAGVSRADWVRRALDAEVRRAS